MGKVWLDRGPLSLDSCGRSCDRKKWETCPIFLIILLQSARTIPRLLISGKWPTCFRYIGQSSRPDLSPSPRACNRVLIRGEWTRPVIRNQHAKASQARLPLLSTRHLSCDRDQPNGRANMQIGASSDVIAMLATHATQADREAVCHVGRQIEHQGRHHIDAAICRRILTSFMRLPNVLFFT